MTAGIMAVSSAIVCQVSAGAVDVTLENGTAVASWADFEVDLSKAGTATEDSSLVISCPAPDGAENGHRLFSVVLNDKDWEDPTYSMSYDDSRTEFSLTVPGSELVGRSKLTIQGGNTAVNITVKAVGFAEDTRATAELTLDLPLNISMDAYTDDNTIGVNASYEINVTDQFNVKTYGDLLDTFKGADLPAGKYVSDSLGLGADGFEMNIGFMCRDGNGGEYWGCTNDTVSYKDGGFLAIDSDNYYPGSRDDTIGEINVTIRPKMEYVESEGKNQAVSEKVRNLKDGDTITIQTAKDTRATAELTLDLPINISMDAHTDDNTIGVNASYEINVTDQFNVKTYGDLLDMFKGADLPAGKYVSDSLGLGADGFEMNIGFMCRDGNGNEYWGSTNDTVSYKDGGFLAIDSDNYYSGSRDDTIGEINVTIRPRMEYVESEGKNQAVSEKVRNLKDGDTITIQTAEDTRSEVTVPAPTGAIVMYCFRNEWHNGTMANADIPAASVSGITTGKTTVKELKQTVKNVSSSGKPVYTKDSLNVGKDAFSYAVWLHLKNGAQED